MKRRAFFTSLLVAPAAVVATGLTSTKPIGGLVPVGIAGHDISKGSIIYGNDMDRQFLRPCDINWKDTERYKRFGP